jgi:ubiquinone/menaquinone biosynthesis C-methylase UbiE
MDAQAERDRQPGRRAGRAVDVVAEHFIDFFDGIAPSYDDWANGLHRKAARRLGELVDPKPGQHALDVGCGTGLLARQLADAIGPKGTVVGIDISEGMLTQARKERRPNLTLVSMAAERLVFRDQTFDVITMGEVLTYLLDPFEALSEALRVLKPDGRLGVSSQRRSLMTEAQDVFFASLVALSRRHHLSVPRLSAERANFGEPEMLPGILEVAGFKHVKTTQLVTGGRAKSAEAWMELMAGAGPLPYTMLGVLGPQLRKEFARELEEDMAGLGEEAFTYHHAYVLATATK